MTKGTYYKIGEYMKIAMIMTLALFSSLAFAKPAKYCDLALVKGTDGKQQFGYPQEFINAMEDKGYRAYQVNDVMQAGLFNSNYFIVYQAKCSGNVWATTSTTRLTMMQEEGISYKTILRLDSAPQTNAGRCAIDLMSFVPKIPTCR